MKMFRREFLASAIAMLALGPSLALAVPASLEPSKPIGWAKWTAESDWFPVYVHMPSAWFNRGPRCTPYAVVACYADAA